MKKVLLGLCLLISFSSFADESSLHRKILSEIKFEPIEPKPKITFEPAPEAKCVFFEPAVNGTTISVDLGLSPEWSKIIHQDVWGREIDRQQVGVRGEVPGARGGQPLRLLGQMKLPAQPKSSKVVNSHSD